MDKFYKFNNNKFQTNQKDDDFWFDELTSDFCSTTDNNEIENEKKSIKLIQNANAKFLNNNKNNNLNIDLEDTLEFRKYPNINVIPFSHEINTKLPKEIINLRKSNQEKSLKNSNYLFNNLNKKTMINTNYNLSDSFDDSDIFNKNDEQMNIDKNEKFSLNQNLNNTNNYINDTFEDKNKAKFYNGLISEFKKNIINMVLAKKDNSINLEKNIRLCVNEILVNIFHDENPDFKENLKEFLVSDIKKTIKNNNYEFNVDANNNNKYNNYEFKADANKNNKNNLSINDFDETKELSFEKNKKSESDNVAFKKRKLITEMTMYSFEEKKHKKFSIDNSKDGLKDELKSLSFKNK